MPEQVTNEERLQYRLQSEELVSRITSLFVGLLPDEIEAGIFSALGLIGEFYGIDRCCLFRFLDDRAEITRTHEWHNKAVPGKDCFHDLPAEIRSQLLSRIKKSENVCIPDAEAVHPEDVLLKDHFRASGIASLLLVPLHQYDVVRGFIGFESIAIEKRWHREDYSIFRVLGDVLLAALQRRRAEEFSNNILASLGEGVAVLDRNYRIITANKVYCEQAGRTLSDVKGRTCYEVSHNRSLPCGTDGEECILVKTFEKELPQNALHSHTDIEGNVQYMAVRSYPMKDASGAVNAVITVTNNITEKISLEQQLDRAKQMEVVGKLVAGVAHEVRTPLYVILSMTEILSKKLGEKTEIVPYLTHITNHVNLLSSLMNDLLDYSKPVERISLQRMSLSDLCASVVASWPNCRYGATHTVLLGEIDTAAPLYINADVQSIQRVIQNLLENAAQHSPEGAAIKLIFDSLKKLARLRIIDSGTGIRKDYLPRVFEPFFSTRKGGTGLGLSIVKNIVESHSGRIELKNNTPLPGCTVEVCFPVEKESF